LGTGKNKKSSATDTSAYMIVGYSNQSGANALAATAYTETSHFGTFCLKNDSTSVGAAAYTLETDTTKCADSLTAYNALVPITNADLPHGYTEVTTTTLGL
jgi:hypothetical protein